MRQYQKRVVTEKKDLDQKIKSLEKFLANPPKIGKQDIWLLGQQLEHMRHYSGVLGERIRRFE